MRRAGAQGSAAPERRFATADGRPPRPRALSRSNGPRPRAAASRRGGASTPRENGCRSRRPRRGAADRAAARPRMPCGASALRSSRPRRAIGRRRDRVRLQRSPAPPCARPHSTDQILNRRAPPRIGRRKGAAREGACGSHAAGWNTTPATHTPVPRTDPARGHRVRRSAPAAQGVARCSRGAGADGRASPMPRGHHENGTRPSAVVPITSARAVPNVPRRRAILGPGPRARPQQARGSPRAGAVPEPPPSAATTADGHSRPAARLSS